MIFDLLKVKIEKGVNWSYNKEGKNTKFMFWRIYNVLFTLDFLSCLKSSAILSGVMGVNFPSSLMHAPDLYYMQQEKIFIYSERFIPKILIDFNI